MLTFVCGVSISYLLLGINPYKIPAGVELDALIHARIFREESSFPLEYSSNPRLAEKVRVRIKVLFGFPVVTGQTRLKATPYFARFESGPSSSTEVLADTIPLAICRLALLLSERHGSE